MSGDSISTVTRQVTKEQRRAKTMNHLPKYFAALLLTTAGSLFAAESQHGIPVTYQLPATGTLPQTYRVTLAIVDTKNPDWIISQFAAGVARTVTPENGGRFSEVWDGLDDNFMPVPPGEYAVKGVYMAARQWPVDKEWQSVTP